MSILGKPAINPSAPYIGPLASRLSPGKFVRIVGTVSSVGKQFFSNLQCGSSHFDDVALHISIRLNEKRIVIKCQQVGTWHNELTFENLAVSRGKQFEILIICELTVFKIGINGRHLCEFPHKVPYERVSHLRIEGDLTIAQISIEAQPTLIPPINICLQEMNYAPPPYPETAASVQMTQPGAPYQPLNNGPPHPPLNSGQPYPPLNSGPQYPMTYPNQNAPATGPYPYNPLLQQQQQPPQPLNAGAINAMPRSYQGPTWSGWGRYGGNRKTALIISGVFVAIFITIFLVVLFVVILPTIQEHRKHFQQTEQEINDFRKKHFPDFPN